MRLLAAGECWCLRREGMVLTAKAMSTAELVEDCAPCWIRAKCARLVIAISR